MKTNKHRDHEHENATPSDPTSKGLSPGSPHRTAYERACRQIALGNYQKALDLLRNMSADPRVRNAMGVCLLRIGRIEDAVRLLRSLVLEPKVVVVHIGVDRRLLCDGNSQSLGAIPMIGRI